MTESREPIDIVKSKGCVVTPSSYYQGYAAALKTAFGEVLIVSKDVETLRNISDQLMFNEPNFDLDESLTQEVGIFNINKIKKLDKKL